jgi:hypothetical protein
MPGGVLLMTVALFEKRRDVKIQMINPGFTRRQGRWLVGWCSEFSGFRQAFHLMRQLVQAWRRG